MIQPNDVDCEVYKYAFECYKNVNSHRPSSWNEEDFIEDYQRFWYVIKLLTMYQNSGNLNIRLLFNHLIILSNVFGSSLAEILLRLSIEKANYEVITYTLSILYYLGYIPETKDLFILNEEYLLNDIPIDIDLINKIEAEL